MQEIIYKVFGSLEPVPEEIELGLNSILHHWGLASGCTWDSEFLHFDFEGIFFPLDEVLEFLQAYINVDSQGRLDVLNLEEWTLTRTEFQGTMQSKTISLNQVLEYSGH